MSWFRQNRLAAIVMLIAILCRAVVPAGWMPAVAASGDQGLTLVICTPTGLSHISVGADGKPGKSAPLEDLTHEHQLCPFAATAHLAPSTNEIALPLPTFTEVRFVANLDDSSSYAEFYFGPHSPRGPPSFA